MPKATDHGGPGVGPEPEVRESGSNVTDDIQQLNDDREHLYILRETHIECLNRFIVEINDDEQFGALDEDDLAVRKERIEAHFADMERAHRLYRQVCVLASNEVYDCMEINLLNMMSKIRKRFRELRGNEHSSIEDGGFTRGATNANSTVAQPFPSVIRVETTQPPKIGTFNGDAAAWPAFRDLFIAEVHNRDFEPVAKLLYLQDACIEKAAEKLGPWQPTNDNYKEAWDSMMAAYNDDYHVIHGILGKLFAVEHQERESHESLSKVVDVLNNTQRQLQAICPQSTNPLLDQVWIHVAKQRLPKKTLDSWEQYRNRDGAMGLPTGDSFRKFLETKARGRREFELPDAGRAKQTCNAGRSQRESSNRFRPYEQSRDQAKSYSGRDESYGGRDRSYNGRDKSYQGGRNESGRTTDFTECVTPSCKQSHAAWRCDAFFKLPLTERRDLI